MFNSSPLLRDPIVGATLIGRVFGANSFGYLRLHGWTRSDEIYPSLASDLSAGTHRYSRGAVFTRTQLGSVVLMLPQDLDVSVLEVQKRLTLYGDGFYAYNQSLALSGTWTPSKIALIANCLVSGSAYISIDGSQKKDFELCAEEDLARVDQLLGRSVSASAFRPRYTEISCNGISRLPRGDLPDWPRCAQRDMLAVVIRRAADFSEYRLEGPSKKYQSQSFYVGDFVCSTPHNLFVFVRPDSGHIEPRFYQAAYERRRVLAAALEDIDLATSSALSRISELPRRLKELREVTNSNGAKFIEFTRWIDSFRITPSAIASRARSFDAKVDEMLEIDAIVEQLRGKFSMVEEILTTRYSLRLQFLLQVGAVIVGVLTILVTALGLYETYYLSTISSNG